MIARLLLTPTRQVIHSGGTGLSTATELNGEAVIFTRDHWILIVNARVIAQIAKNVSRTDANESVTIEPNDILAITKRNADSSIIVEAVVVSGFGQ